MIINRRAFSGSLPTSESIVSTYGEYYKYRHLDAREGGHTLTIALSSASSNAPSTTVDVYLVKTDQGITVLLDSFPVINNGDQLHVLKTYTISGHYDLNIVNNITGATLSFQINS